MHIYNVKKELQSVGENNNFNWAISSNSLKNYEYTSYRQYTLAMGEKAWKHF